MTTLIVSSHKTVVLLIYDTFSKEHHNKVIAGILLLGNINHMLTFANVGITSLIFAFQSHILHICQPILTLAYIKVTYFEICA